MPSALASGDRTIFWWRGNVTPPKDYQRWEDLIRNLVQHFTERYGTDEVKTWYFEIWNEPSLTPYFWTGTQDDYFKLYQHAARAIKSVNTAYRVGGPATAGAAWEAELIDFCYKNNIPIDFISTHSYGVEQGYLDQYGEHGTILSKNPWSVSNDIITTRKEIASSPMPHLELHYTEWSSSYTPSDPIHDSYHQAAYILEKIKQVGDAPNSMSYWVFTDIFEEAGPRFTPFHGGFGLLNYQGIKKPAYHAFAFLNKLGDIELQSSDPRSWACKNANGDLQILCWDFTYTLPDSTNNQDYYTRNLPSRFKGKIVLNISSLPAGKYCLETYRIGYKHNDPYTAYLEMGSPQQLSPRQVEILKQHSTGQPLSQKIIEVLENQIFKHEVLLNENDVYLFIFKKL
jgi:xylan 1,4-beta-xylosidase